MARLVAIGDSLTQGFQSLAITRTDLSYPALIAQCMGLGPGEFQQHGFRSAGGMPCSMEWLARRLEERYGAQMNGFEWGSAVFTIGALFDEVEDYWERGKGAKPQRDVDYHNLAVWGFQVADAYEINAGICRDCIGLPRNGWFSLPSQPRLRTAYHVLNPAQERERDTDTQLAVAERIKQRDGNIDHLIVALGSNNCLGTVIDLEIRETGDVPPGPSSAYNLWSPRLFELQYGLLAERVAAIGAKHVYVATVPHVTIAPVTRGLMRGGGELPSGHRYFDYYISFSCREENFDPERDRHLSGQDAGRIDRTIDAYNVIIRERAAEHGFVVVDLCAQFDALAVRRNHGTPTFTLPAALADLSVELFQITPQGKLRQGGLVSLDGVHPTSCGYGLIAQAFIDHLRVNEPGIEDIDFELVRRNDTLVSSPPRTLDDMTSALETLEKHFKLSRWTSHASQIW